MTVVVHATGLRKSFRSGDAIVRALDGVDVAVDAGEFLAITGPSGSGKTTLLHCLAGVVEPDAGEVRLRADLLSALDDDARTDLRRRHLGFVFQRRNLLGPLTVAENVQLPLLMRGDDRPAIERRTAEVLDAVGLADRARSRPAELSGGQAQRVAIARALATEPAVIFADEPTGQLDAASAVGVAELLRDLADGGTTVVLVTHDGVVADRATRRVELVDGRIAG